MTNRADQYLLFQGFYRDWQNSYYDVLEKTTVLHKKQTKAIEEKKDELSTKYHDEQCQMWQRPTNFLEYYCLMVNEDVIVEKQILQCFKNEFISAYQVIYLPIVHNYTKETNDNMDNIYDQIRKYAKSLGLNG